MRREHHEARAASPFCLGVILFALICLASSAHAAETPAPGEKFPDLTTANLEGELPDLSAAKVVIVDFWASWCAPCRQSFPVYAELQREYGSRGLVIVGVNVDRRAGDMEKFLQRHPPGFAIARDAAQKLVASVAVPTMPTAFVLDRHGIVRYVHRGFHGERSRREYVQQIDALLSESP